MNRHAVDISGGRILGGGAAKSPHLPSNFQDPGKSGKYCLCRVWVDAGAATAAQMVRMDHLLCRECAEVVFIDVLMVCRRFMLRFRLGSSISPNLT